MPAAATGLACDLCGLDCGRDPITRKFEAAEHHFCCAGCQNVYAILLESGVIASGQDFRQSEVYLQSLKLGLISRREGVKPVIPPNAPTQEAMYRVSGMWCSSCAWLIEHALQKEAGVVSADVSFASDLVRVKYCPQYLPPSRIPERITALGYRAEEYSTETRSDRDERRGMLLRIGIAGFLWMNVMLFSLPIYASYWEPIWEMARVVVPFILLGLATPAVFYSGWPILRMAFLGVRHGSLRVESLLALGILAAYTYSAIQAFTGGKHYYFDTACAIVTLVLLGKTMERGAKQRTTQSIAMLYRMMPNKARLIADGRERFVSVDALQPGSVFVVKAGERIPSDGVVASGASHVDESVLTGESAPRSKSAGDEVIGGSLNAGNVIEVRATRVAAESTLRHMIRAVEAAVNSRSQIERTVDRVSRVFVPVTIVIALATVLGGLLVGVSGADAMLRGIAVLVIACPCALGVATPLAVTAAIGAASRRGILVSDSSVLETVGKVDLVVLDKTGTMTDGVFRLLEAEMDVLPLLAAVERYSEHPLGRAVVQHAVDGGVAIPAASGIEVHKGMGISGLVDGVRVTIGNRHLFGGLDVPVDRAAQHEREGRTTTFWSTGARTGVLVFGDTLREGAAQLVASLHERGVRTSIVSGDSEATTAWAARTIGADEYRAEALPHQKGEIIRAYQNAGASVAMVGDGVNDAPALAAANLGIALGSGADLAMQAAPVVLMKPSLDRVTEVFEIAHLARRIVAQNLFWAFFYNAAGITLAVTGVLNPILAAVAMVLSSLSVIANSSRLTRWRAD
jgi:heavy metal translocating P-type ATPase